MTLVQVTFLVALTLVMCAVVAFAALVVVGATRSGQGMIVNARLMQRMLRGPAERAEVDRWVFYAHRVSGFAIFGFLCLHVLDVSLYAASSRLYAQVHDLYGNAIMRVFECGLLFAILFHTFNGLRILSIDLGDLGASVSRRILAGAVILTIILSIVGSVVILKPVVT